VRLENLLALRADPRSDGDFTSESESDGDDGDDGDDGGGLRSSGLGSALATSRK
jgi:hypothetical protein